MNEEMRHIGLAAEGCDAPGAEGTWDRNRVQRLEAEPFSMLDGSD
jgi:hypothetical protein